MSFYDSENAMGVVSVNKEICTTPPRSFSTHMLIVDAYDQGFSVACNVDGILCLSKADAEACFKRRLDELWQKWEQQKNKI